VDSWGSRLAEAAVRSYGRRVGDIYLALSNRDGELAQRLWRRYEPELRLLDQLGWSPVEPV
jgi:hypothetical protein